MSFRKLCGNFLIKLDNLIIFGSRLKHLKSLHYFITVKFYSFPGWNTGGALWFSDLTMTDPNFIVPALSSVLIGFTIFVSYIFRQLILIF